MSERETGFKLLPQGQRQESAKQQKCAVPQDAKDSGKTVPSQSVWALRIWILFFMIRDDQMYGGQKPDVLDSLFVCICVCVCLCDAFSMCLGGGLGLGFL